MPLDSAVDRYLTEHHDRNLAELKEFLRIPSCSALTANRDDVRRAAEWVATRLRDMGFPTVAVEETGGHPVVYANWPAPTGKPTALLYGHYDVQPPDPLELWRTPPFEPTERDGRLWARGASDDKGNMYMPIAALQALVAVHGRPPIGITCMFEGEEEIGSPSLPAWVRANKAKLRADLAICADGGLWGPDQPSLAVASKGICGGQINLRAANIDLHSGQHGAAVPNALERMARLASTFHTADGRVAIAGFYDDVRELTAEERAEFGRIPFTEEEYAAEVGLTADQLWGEPGYSALERRWARPTCDFNGLWGGFQGDGSKTVTPGEAHLKITCRLVPNQDPAKIIKLIQAHVEKHQPAGTTIDYEWKTGSARPFEIRLDRPALQTAGRVLKDLYGKDPLIIRMGGTLPIAETIVGELGVDFVFYSFGMPDSQVHAPNESFHLSVFDRARRAHAAYLLALGE